MYYKITRLRDNTYSTQVEDYAVSDELTWAEWIQKSGIQVHTAEGTVIDISPDDMLAQIPDAEAMKRQLELMGVKKRITDQGQPIYELDEDIDSISVSRDLLSLCDAESQSDIV